MGEYDKARRAMEDAERQCPNCQAQNIRGAKPTLEPEQDGSFTCATCSHNWKEKQ